MNRHCRRSIRREVESSTRLETKADLSRIVRDTIRIVAERGQADPAIRKRGEARRGAKPKLPKP